jgi:hypothetical protein
MHIQYIYIYTHTHTHTNICIIYMQMCLYVYLYKHICIYIYIYKCVFMYIYTSISVFIYTNIFVLYIYKYICMCVCIYMLLSDLPSFCHETVYHSQATGIVMLGVGCHPPVSTGSWPLMSGVLKWEVGTKLFWIRYTTEHKEGIKLSPKKCISQTQGISGNKCFSPR